MEPYQERVVEELKELNLKRTKLADFMFTSLFSSLEAEAQSHLLAQASIMKEYANILETRIAYFRRNQK